MRTNAARVVPLALGVLGLFARIGMAADPPKLSAKAERGRYLVEEVAKCQICHTPRNDDGQLDRERWMKGASLNVQPIEPIKDWHKSAPDITPSGRLWAKWTEKGVLDYMQTGLTPAGKQAGPPMPAYKLPLEDAGAIVEYLKTIK